MKKNYTDLFIGIFFLLLSGVTFLLTLNMQSGSAMFVRILVLLLTIFSVSFIIKSIKAKTHENIRNSIFKKKEIAPLKIFVLIVLFALSLSILGFKISAFLLILASVYIIAGKISIYNVVLGLIVPILFDVLFRIGLNVRLPLGILPF